MYTMPTTNFKNTANYGPYLELVQTAHQTVYTDSIKSLDELNNHFTSLLNIFRDGIETELLKIGLVTVVFHDGVSLDLCLTDYYTNNIMWHLYYAVNEPIDSSKLFFTENITKSAIKQYIDKFLSKYRRIYENKILNNIIDDCLFKFKYVDEFAFFLCNTFKLEDFITLGKQNPEFYNALHVDFTGVPAEDIKKIGMKNSDKAIEIIKNSDHCLADTFRVGDGIKAKQFKEFAVDIGIKPDGQGSVFPLPISNSYINGGPTNVAQAMIESSTGRTAQIIAKMNVSTSGDFARLLGLNNMDTFLHPDPHYCCDTKNLLKINITNAGVLKMYENRYYKLYEDGVEMLLTLADTHLIGRTIYVRSPETCASKSRGEGICYRCYGDLAYTNRLLNIGKFAAEQLSSQLTQMLLSAKHILESAVKKLIWTEDFDKYFEIEYNNVKIRDDVNLKGCNLLLDPEEIYQDDEYDESDFNEYVYQIEMQDAEGNIHKFELITSGEDSNDSIYITPYLNEIISKKKKMLDGKYVVPMSDLKESIFTFIMYNNELSSVLKNIEKTINNTKIVSSHDRNSIVQELVNLVNKSGLVVNAVHLEVIISNQIRCGASDDNVLCEVDWSETNPQYTILPLSRSLLNNPSVTISLQYRNLNKALYNPLTFKKTKASGMDLFFMETPQNYVK